MVKIKKQKLGKHVQVQLTLSGKRCQPTQAPKGGGGAVGMRQDRRQPIRRRRPQLSWTGVEGWLRQKVSDGRDNDCGEIIIIARLSL
jgi:hypothetical protein